jgi:diamine N-acetyltransferase
MENVVIESNEIMFCYTKPEDLCKVMEMEQVYDEQGRKYVHSWPRERHLQVINSEEWMHITVKRKSSADIIGYVLLEGIRSEHGTIELTRIVIKEKGKGYGRESLRMIKRLCFEKLGCHRLWLDVYEYNKRAIELYKSEGFLHEGIIRECKKYDDNYYSMHIMSILENEYRR